MALVPRSGVGMVREVCEWALNVIGYWKILLSICVLYGLHILQVAIMRLIDGLFNTSFVSMSIGSLVESWAWRFLQPLMLQWHPVWLCPWFSGPALEQPSEVSSAVLSIASGSSDGVSRYEPSESIMGTRMAMAASFLIQMMVLLRRRM